SVVKNNEATPSSINVDEGVAYCPLTSDLSSSPVHLVEVKPQRRGERDVAKLEDRVGRLLCLDELVDALLRRRRDGAVALAQVRARLLDGRARVRLVVADCVNDVGLQKLRPVGGE